MYVYKEILGAFVNFTARYKVYFNNDSQITIVYVLVPEMDKPFY